PPPRHSSPVFPYTTLFRSTGISHAAFRRAADVARDDKRRDGGTEFAAQSQHRIDARRASPQAEVGHDQIGVAGSVAARSQHRFEDRKSTRLNSSHEWISYA